MVREFYSGIFLTVFSCKVFHLILILLRRFWGQSCCGSLFLRVNTRSTGSRAHRNRFVDYDSANSGWDFYDYDVMETSEYDPELEVRVPIISSQNHIERQSAYFVFKIALPMLLLLLISWSIFWIRIEQIESRVTIGIVCFLSLIAYNFVIESEIPKLGYVTFMDFFILISYLFAGSCVIFSIAERYF